MAAASTTRVLPDGRRARGRRTRRRGRAARAAAEVVDVDERGLARALERQGLRLGERVDQGSFAVVYKATSAGMRGGDETSWQGAEGTLHAVKILSATASTVSSRRDFKREATLLTRVNHPGIVKVQHYDETPQPYMVTEFCTSGNLWNALRAEEIKATRFAGASGSPAPVPEEMPLLDFPTLMKDVADALTYLHTAGIRPPRHQDGKHFAHLVVGAEPLASQAVRFRERGARV
jgi:serine/threonine protein kinase